METAISTGLQRSATVTSRVAKTGTRSLGMRPPLVGVWKMVYEDRRGFGISDDLSSQEPYAMQALSHKHLTFWLLKGNSLRDILRWTPKAPRIHALPT